MFTHRLELLARRDLVHEPLLLLLQPRSHRCHVRVGLGRRQRLGGHVRARLRGAPSSRRDWTDPPLRSVVSTVYRTVSCAVRCADTARAAHGGLRAQRGAHRGRHRGSSAHASGPFRSFERTDSVGPPRAPPFNGSMLTQGDEDPLSAVTSRNARSAPAVHRRGKVRSGTSAGHRGSLGYVQYRQGDPRLAGTRL